jgi:hypothetical protein
MLTSFGMTLRNRSGIFIVFLLCFNVFETLAGTQLLTWFDAEFRLRKRIDLQAQSLEMEQAPGVWILQSRVKVDSSILHRLPPRIAPHYFLLSNGNIRFTLAGTGQVFDFDASRSTLKRVDHTFYAGYNFGAAVFQRKNQIYSFGGSGFWDYSKALTYYQESGWEWENIKSTNLGPHSIFNGFEGYSDSTDLFYTGGSEYHDFLLNQATKVDSKFYAFDFNKNKWIFLGEINPKLIKVTSKEIFWSGRYFIQFSDQRIYIIDPINNKVTEVKSVVANFQPAPEMYVQLDKIYAFWDEEGGKRKVYSISDLLKSGKSIGSFYELPSNRMVYLLVVLLALGLVVVYSISKRRKKPVLELDQSEFRLFQSLLASTDGLSTVEVNEILGIAGKNIDNQRKIRLQVISNINHKFHLKYRIENVIIRNLSEVDKRQSLYSLKPEGVKMYSRRD